MRVLVCGSRDYTDVRTIAETLRRLPLRTVVITGGNGYYMDGDRERPCKTVEDLRKAHRGADALAFRFAELMYLEPTPPFWPDWSKGKKGGPDRNQRMLDEGKPDHVIAFPLENSVGTWDMIRRARKAGIPVEIQE